MEAFQELIYSKRIDISYLTTHRFNFEDAPKAYDIIQKHSEPHIGMVLEYDFTKEHLSTKLSITESAKVNHINVGFVGAGSYAQGNLLPYLPSVDEVGRIGVMTSSGTTSKRVAEKYKFQFCTSNINDIIENKEINTLFIATRHNTHAQYAIDALKAGMNVYVEKPLCMNIDEMLEIQNLCVEKNKGVMIGFNRRFSPSAQEIKKKIGSGKMSMIYRINAGYIPKSSWIQDLAIGGGRVIGEVCHFIDLMTYMCGSLPCKVMASVMPDSEGLNDTINIIVEFENGSSGIIGYYANGAKSLPKEYFEVYSSGTVGIIYDFKKSEIYGKKTSKNSTSTQNKGQKAMMDEFFKSMKEGKLPISMDEIFSVTKATFAIIKSIQENGQPVKF